MSEAEWGQEVPVDIRYEDVTQDGRLKVCFLPHAMGTAGWRTLLRDHPIRELATQGILPILNRLWVRATDEPVAVGPGYTARARLQLAHTQDEAGNTNRILMHLMSEVFAPRGRTYGPAPTGAGERVKVGDLFAQHVFTRPFGAPEERKVLELAHPRLPNIPEFVARWCPGHALLDDAPEDAAWQPPIHRRLGLRDTDSNQHVNSLVYPHLFEEAALAATDSPEPSLLLREIELSFRRPTFAGSEVAIHTRYWSEGQSRRGDGSISDTSARPEPGHTKPFCTARFRLDTRV